MWSLIRLWSRASSLMLVTSAVMRRELGEQNCARISVWMRGVDTELFHPRFKRAEFKARGAHARYTHACMLYVRCLW